MKIQLPQSAQDTTRPRVGGKLLEALWVSLTTKLASLLSAGHLIPGPEQNSPGGRVLDRESEDLGSSPASTTAQL